ncbi:conserved hypothetical protein, partial [Ricinus communis]
MKTPHLQGIRIAKRPGSEAGPFSVARLGNQSARLLLAARLLFGAAPCLLHEALVHALLGLGRTVVESPEPLVERDDAIGVIALEILVMEIVVVAVGIDGALLADDDLVEAGMARCRGKACMRQVEDRMDRIGRHDPVDQHTGEIEKVLDRVHGKTGPRAGIDVVMMQLVDRMIQRRPVDEAMHQIEM